ncbi:MAG: ABC transporter ATP-binding protein [Hyphomonadaceae bacterium]|nr:ABC transporter ATP-binding protein [Hyphomonadaceae bacterium]
MCDRRTRTFYWIAVATGVIAGALSAAPAYWVAKLIDALATREGGVVYFVAALLASHAGARLAGTGRHFFYGRAEARRRVALMVHLAERVLRARVRSNEQRASPAPIIESADSGARMFSQHASFGVLPAFAELFAALWVLAGLQTPMIACLFAATGIAYAAAFARSASALKQAAGPMLNTRAKAGARLIETLYHVEALKLATAEADAVRRLVGSFRRAERLENLLNGRRALSDLAAGAVFVAGLSVLLLTVLVETGRGAMGAGEAALVLIYCAQISRPLEMIGLAWRDLAQAQSALARAMQLDAQPQETQAARVAPARVGGGAAEEREFAIVLEDFALLDPDGGPMFEPLNFSVGYGDTYVIAGASGAGKTSMMRLLAGFEVKARGRVLIGDIPIADLASDTLRRQIAFCPQEPCVIEADARANLSLGVDSFDAQKAGEILSDLGLSTRLSTRQADLGFAGRRLSGGERARLALARALLRGADILVLDEPSAALDSATESAMMRAVRRHAPHAALILFTHSEQLHAAADHVVKLTPFGCGSTA